MDTFSKHFASLDWWIGIVLVGVLLNLVSTYLLRRVDRILSTISSRWDKRTSRKRKERDQLVQYLSDHPDEQLQLLAEEIRCMFRTIKNVGLATALIIISFVAEHSLATGVFLLLSLILIFFGLAADLEAMRLSRLVSDAREIKHKVDAS